MNSKHSISKDTEGSLLEQYYRTGDLDLLGALYKPYMHLVYGLCLRYLKDSARSEDAVMQIFEVLVKKLRIHRVSNFKSWLYTLARNHCLMQLRKDQKEVVITGTPLMENLPDGHLINEAAQKEEQLQAMERCIGQLKPEQQTAVRLFYLEQKCYQEISELTGFEIKKVKSYIQNGKRNLKICMEKSSRS